MLKLFFLTFHDFVWVKSAFLTSEFEVCLSCLCSSLIPRYRLMQQTSNISVKGKAAVMVPACNDCNACLPPPTSSAEAVRPSAAAQKIR